MSEISVAEILTLLGEVIVEGDTFPCEVGGMQSSEWNCNLVSLSGIVLMNILPLPVHV